MNVKLKLGLLILLLLFYACGVNDSFLREAESLYDQRNYTQVIELLEKHRKLVEDKNKDRFSKLLIKSFYNNGQYHEVINFVSEENMKGSEYIGILGYSYKNIGLCDKAIDLLKQYLIFESENDAKVLNDIGKCYEMLKDTLQASTYFSYSIQNDSTFSPAWNNLGVIYESFGLYDKAVKCYDRAILYDSLESTYYFNRGVSNLYLKQNHNAAVDLKRAIQLNLADNNQLYEFNLAIAYYQLDSIEACCRILDRLSLKDAVLLRNSVCSSLYGKGAT